MSNNIEECPVSFKCHNNRLHGILSIPKEKPNQAVIIVVGGPQYRVGSHRQFVLLARYLASLGVLVLRFDYSGMGYSDGVPSMFYEIDEDIASAVSFVSSKHDYIEKIYLWGLCDAASAISFYAYQDERIDGVILLNPWVRSQGSHSKAVLENYYRERLFSPDVWRELILSPAKILTAIKSFAVICIDVLRSRLSQGNQASIQDITREDRVDRLADSVLRGIERYKGRICLILSERDLTADEFKIQFEANDALREKTMDIHKIEGADHTFSSQRWRREVERVTQSFMNI